MRLYYCPECQGAGSREVGVRFENGRRYTGNDPYFMEDVECPECDSTGHVRLSREEGEGLRPYTPSRRRWTASIYRKGRPYSPERDPLVELARARVAGIGYRSAAYAHARERALGVRS